LSDTWKPDFTKSNPYEGVPDSYLQKIYGTQAYDTALNKGWIQPYQPAKQQEQTTTTTSREAQADTWKPDFTKSNPYEGVPDSYLQKIYGTNAYNVAVNKGWIKPLYEPGIYGPIYYPAKVEPTKSEIIRREKSETIRQQQQRDLKQISEVPTTSEKVTPTIPFERKYYEAIDFGDTQGRTFWRMLTPWSEEKGQTITTHIKDLPKRMTTVPDQNELKAQYEAEKDNPLWSRILLGGDTVIKDEKGNYLSIIAGEAPLITPATRVVKTATIPIDYYKIAEQARKARLANQWEVTLKILEQGSKPTKAAKKVEYLTVTARKAAHRAEQVAQKRREIRYAKYAEKAKAPVEVQIETYKAAEAAQAAKIEAIKAAQRKPATLVIPGMSIDATAFNKEIAVTLSKLEPNKALQELNKTELTPVFFLSHPQIVTSLINKVDTKTQTQTINEIEKAIQQATKTREITKTQEKEATELITELKEKTKEKTETKEETETKTETQVKPVTETVTKEKTTTEKGDKKTRDRTFISTGIGTVSQRLRFPTSEIYQETARKEVKSSTGAIAWRMGQLGGKDRWDVVVNPYTANEHYYMILGKQPEGATVLKRGKGSAYGTAQVVRGIAPKRDVKVDSGFVDITITPTSKNSVKMRVTPDPKMETKGDITIGNSKPRISRRIGRISPRMPKLK